MDTRMSRTKVSPVSVDVDVPEQPSNVSLVERCLREEERLVNLLHEMIDNLENRMAMVLGPDNPSKGVDGTDSPSSSSLVKSLDTFNDKLRDAVFRITSIIERLEV